MGGDTTVQTPTPPAAPTTQESIDAWVKSMPQIFETQLKYAPQQAAQQVELAQQYAQPMGQAMLEAQKAMYPTEHEIRTLAGQQALEGMQGQIPDWQRAQYQSDLGAYMGTTAGSPIGADYMSVNMLKQQQDYQKYFRDLGLSLADKQPIAMAQQPQTTDYMSGYTPQGVMSSMQQGYGNYAGLYGSMYGANAQMAMQPSPFGQIMGGLAGGLGTGIGTGMGYKMMSSQRYKTNIRPWKQ